MLLSRQGWMLPRPSNSVFVGLTFLTHHFFFSSKDSLCLQVTCNSKLSKHITWGFLREDGTATASLTSMLVRKRRDLESPGLVQILFVGLFGMFGMCYVSCLSMHDVATLMFTAQCDDSHMHRAVLVNYCPPSTSLSSSCYYKCALHIFWVLIAITGMIILILLILIIQNCLFLNPRSGRTSPTRRVLLGPKTVEDDMILYEIMYVMEVWGLSWRFEVWGVLLPFVGCQELHSLKRI